VTSAPITARAFTDVDAVVRRTHLLAAGVTLATMRSQLGARRWRELNDSVICLHNGPLTPEQARMAVVASAQWPAALCAVTAMSLWGVVGVETDVVHVVVRRGARVLPVPGVRVKVHESRRFTDADVSRVRQLPATSLDRATIDAAAWTPDAREAARIIVAPVQQRRTTAKRLMSTLASAGQVRHRRVLAALLADIEGGAEALSESEFLAFCRRHGLPRPMLQVRLDSAGRRRYIDATLRAGDRVVRVEVDGGVHLSLTQRWRDTAKDNDAALDGRVILRFPSVAIYTDDPVAVRQLRRALGLVSA
jgi:hypothetical protein